MEQKAFPEIDMPRANMRASESGFRSLPVDQTRSHFLRSPWSSGKKYAAMSIMCGIASFFFFPYILAIAGILLGIVALREKYLLGAIGVLVSAAVVPISYLTSLPP